MKVLQKKIDWQVVISNVVFGIILTAGFAKLSFISQVTMMWLDLIVINGGYCLWIGHHYVQRSRTWGILCFPIMYLIGSYFFAPHYMWYFVIIYLGVSYLAWSMGRSDNK